MALEFYCSCLNIHLNIVDGAIQQNEYIKENVTECLLRDGILVFAPHGFIADQKLRCLCRSREVDNWMITSCINCKMDIYATKNGNVMPTTVVVSKSTERNPTAAAEKINLDSFSPVYKLLVSPPASGNQNAQPDCYAVRDFSQSHLEELKEETVQLLNAENERILERIRNFENEQMSRFNELQSRVQKEQNILAQVLTSYHQEKASDMHESHAPSSNNELQTSPHRSVKPSMATPVTASRNQPLQNSSSNPTDDIIFAMDEEDEGIKTQVDHQRGDFNSSEENLNNVSIGTSADEDDDDAFSPITADVKLYATSVPITMPRTWQPSLQTQLINTQDVDISPNDVDHVTKDDPQWIAASIQALAMSVRGNDGTEMFGARPRPRLNTLD